MLNYHYWINLKADVREKVAQALNMPKSGGVEIVNNQLVSDGHTAKDLYATITVENLQKHTGLKSKDIYELFEEFVKQIENPKKVEKEVHVVLEKAESEVKKAVKKITKKYGKK